MVKYLILFFLIWSTAFAQNSTEPVVRKGLLNATGTISFGGMTKHEQTNIYLHGLGEYLVNDWNSLRSDIYFYLKSGDKQMLELNHQLFVGAAFHFNSNHQFVPYVGLQPGLALTQANFVTIQGVTNNVEVSPLISVAMGFNYYASKWFHLFIDGRYVSGKHLSNQKKIDLDELRISFGLGFNINIFGSNSQTKP